MTDITKKNVDNELKEKMKILSSLRKDLEWQFWKWVIMNAIWDKVEVPVISTWLKTLDTILWWWIPKWRIIEIYGEESSWKTTFALHVASQIQKEMWWLVWYIDMEQALDLKWAQHIWVNLERMVISQPDYGEQAGEIIVKMLENWIFDTIVIDSVAAMIPKAELENDLDNSLQMWLHAKLMSKIIKKITPIASKSKTTIIFINQTRQKIWIMFWDPTTTPWGKSLPFAASQRIKIVKRDKITEKNKEKGYYMKFVTVKNKIASPKQETMVRFMYDTCFDYLENLIEDLIEQWKIKKAWAFLSIEIDWKEYKWQWKEKFKQIIIENNLQDILYNL